MKFEVWIDGNGNVHFIQASSSPDNKADYGWTLLGTTKIDVQKGSK